VRVECASLYWAYAGQVVRRPPGRHAYPQTTAPTQYVCADGKPINLALPLTDPAWRRLLAYLRGESLGEGLDDDAYTDPAKRLEQGGKVYAELEVLAAKHTAEELFHAGQRLGMTWGAVRAPEDWLDDEHARDRGFFVEVEHPELGHTVTYPGAPYHFSETPWQITRRAPLLGEHNKD